MEYIEIKNLKKHFFTGGKQIKALDDINLTIEMGKYHALLGPSGCGKTTLLRAIAGLADITSGSIFLNNKDMSHVPAQERDIGFVFQQFALFPHLDVWSNTAYGPKVKGWDKKEVQHAVESNLKLVGLGGRSDAMPKDLSGGMKQKVGLARALATKSKLLLLDEPLSALDAKISEFLRFELKRIAGKQKITAIHVTHNQEEAMTISDNIILMKKGKIVQSGSPEELYNHPRSIFCANFIGKCNFFSGVKVEENVMMHKNHKIIFKGKVGTKKMVAGVRPEKIHFDKESKGRMMQGKIELINFLGYLYEYAINHDGQRIRAYKRIKEYGMKDKFKIGDEVYLWFNAEDTFVWPEPDDFNEEISLE